MDSNVDSNSLQCIFEKNPLKKQKFHPALKFYIPSNIRPIIPLISLLVRQNWIKVTEVSNIFSIVYI